MTCQDCAQAQTAKHWPIFQADCHGCQVRALASGPAYHTAMAANAMTPSHGRMPEAERRTLRSIRLRPAQWEVFNEVGGVRWLEDALELAKKSIQRAAVNAGPGAAEKESPPS